MFVSSSIFLRNKSKSSKGTRFKKPFSYHLSHLQEAVTGQNSDRRNQLLLKSTSQFSKFSCSLSNSPSQTMLEKESVVIKWKLLGNQTAILMLEDDLKQRKEMRKQTFLQRRHTDGQEAHEKLLNITNY